MTSVVLEAGARDPLSLVFAALADPTRRAILARLKGGPVTVGDVEARVALLEGQGLLLGDGDRLLTTEGAVRLERAYFAGVEAGQGRSAPIVPPV